jgi:integrase
MPIRRHAGVPLPDNVFRVKKRSGKEYFYYQERRGRPDKGPLIRLPNELHDPLFWQRIEEIKRGEVGYAAGTFDALIEHFKSQKRYEKLSPSSKEVYGVCFSRISAAWGNLAVRDLLPKHIYRLQDAQSDRPSMANMTVKVLRGLLREGIKHDYTTVNVARDIEYLEEAGEGAEPWSEEVYAFVLEHAPPLIMRTAVLGRATGQRGSDLVKIRPADRDGEGFNILVKKLKNQKHWVPITADAWRAVEKWDAEPMLPYLNVGGRRLSEEGLRSAWSAFRDRHPGHVPQDATLHDLRAMAICDRRLKGVPHQQISDQIRMSLQMVVRYSKHIDQAMNAKAGMVTMERSENASVKTIYAAIENRKT